MTPLSTLPVARPLLLAFLGVWFVATSVPLSFWMSSHTASLPPPAYSVQLSAAAGTPVAEWEAVHILSAECGCSEIVAEYLVGRRAQPGLREHVWVVDGAADWEASLKRAGFVVASRSAEELAAATGIEGAPWLLLRQSGRVAYSGGYSTQRPRPSGSFEDVAIWRALQSGEAVTARPAYGCATSRFLKAARDPLGLKYEL